MEEGILTIPKEKLDSIKYVETVFQDKQKNYFKDPIVKYFFCTGLIKKYFDNPPPKNSSEETLQELFYNKKLATTAPEEYINFAKTTDMQESKFYSNFAEEELGLNLNEKYFESILKQLEPILFLLKEKFNRPRPYQLAPYYNIQIPTKIPHSHGHAAYPSGHALDAYIISHILANKVPQHKEKIYNFCDTIIISRMVANVHYVSDNIISKKLAEDIIEHNLLKNI